MMQMRIVQLKALNKKEKIKQIEEEQKSPSKIHLVSIDGHGEVTESILNDDADLKGEAKKEKVLQPEEPRKPRYFPPKKLVNPFDERQLEFDQFMQTRKEALAKYTEISKNRFK